MNLKWVVSMGVGGILCIPFIVSAHVYNLNPIIVTANREQLPEMETAASVQVITKEQIAAAGARNIYEAMRNVPGVYFNGWGAKGLDFGDHNTTLSVRGLDQGASVLLNGVPLAANNFTQLSSIDVSTVERIEVVKGAGAVLYGPETMTGVINIITKKSNKAKSQGVIEGAWGSRGNKEIRFNYVNKKCNIGYSKSYIGSYKPTTDVYYGWYTDTDVYGHREKGINENIYLNMYIGENFSFMYNGGRSVASWGEVAVDEKLRLDKSYTDTYNVRNNQVIMSYDEKTIKGKVYYMDRTSHLYTQLWNGERNNSDEDYKTKRYGLDIQKKWKIDENKEIILGLSGENERYTELIGVNEGNRHQYSIYGQYTMEINPFYKNVFGLRYQYAKDQKKLYREVVPQWQQLYKISKDEVFYTNIGKSFIMPRIYDYFYTDVESGLTPESGWNYEIGYKKNYPNAHLRVSLFYIDVKDKIKVVKEKPKKKVKNVGKFTSIGTEIEYGQKLNNQWNWEIGIVYANPRNKFDDGQEEQTFPKLQVTSGLNYQSAKWDASLELQFIAKRPHKLKEFFDMMIHTGYKMSNADYLAIDVYNVLNTRNVTSEYDWISYYGDPRTIVIRYKHCF